MMVLESETLGTIHLFIEEEKERLNREHHLKQANFLLNRLQCCRAAPLIISDNLARCPSHSRVCVEPYSIVLRVS